MTNTHAATTGSGVRPTRLNPAIGALVSRLILFALFQAAAAALFHQRGSVQPWAESVAW